MQDDPFHAESSPLESGAAAESFYSGALDRVRHFMVMLGVLLVGGAWWEFGLRPAIGFGFGCAIAYINFYWLKRVIEGFVDRAAGTATSQSGKGIVFRFLLRYALMAAGAYAILTVSPASLNGLLAGLFLPVVAIACEAGYELYAALARGV
ncbi:MAG: ATP synthase subunit I [Candidatus Sulfotelmatobacter sp.]